MISAIISRLAILGFGTLYPAYASYKAVRTKNVKEYVKWMMYWIVYAFFTCIETFTDIFLAWFPFYYEVKVIIVLWLLSPATKGSSTLYRKFVHPMLTRREQEIDEYLNQAKERGYTAVLQLGSKGVNYATNVIMQTALKTFQGTALANQGMMPSSQSDYALSASVHRREYSEFDVQDSAMPRSQSCDAVRQPYGHFEGSSEEEDIFIERQPVIIEEIMEEEEETGAARARAPPKRKAKGVIGAQKRPASRMPIKSRRKIKQEPDFDIDVLQD